MPPQKCWDFTVHRQEPDPFERLRTSVREHGWFAIDQDDSAFGPRLICATKKRPAGGYTGTSFWMAVKDQNYVIAGFGGDCWLIPDAEDWVSVGIDWLFLQCGVGNPPNSLVTRYGLRNLADGELEMMFKETYIPDALKAIYRAQEKCRAKTGHFSDDLLTLTKYADRALHDTVGETFTIQVTLANDDWHAVAINPETGERYSIDSRGVVGS